MSSEITSLRALARAESEIADEARQMTGLAEEIVTTGGQYGLDVTQMTAGREALDQVTQIWSSAAQAHDSAANAATDMDEANAGNVGRDLEWTTRE